MWRQKLEAERSRLLRHVIALREQLKWFAGPFRIGDATETAKQLRETQVALNAAVQRYEKYCIEVMRRDPWPRPVSLRLSQAERAALARRKAPAHQAGPLRFRNPDDYGRHFRAMYPGR